MVKSSTGVIIDYLPANDQERARSWFGLPYHERATHFRNAWFSTESTKLRNLLSGFAHYGIQPSVADEAGITGILDLLDTAIAGELTPKSERLMEEWPDVHDSYED